MLILPIKKKWFDMIVSGEKTEKYVEIKPYYFTRLRNIWGYPAYWGEPHKIGFRNGYSSMSSLIIAECTLSTTTGKPEWGAEPNKNYYVLKIKKIILATDSERTQGNLISREALKETLRSYPQTDDMRTTELIGFFEKLIDNAQSVEITEEQAINKLHETGWLIGHDKEMTTRPKGEWKVRPRTDADGDCDGYDVYCSECRKVLFRLLNRCFSIEEAKKHVEDDFTNFCAECGADMREGDVK